MSTTFTPLQIVKITRETPDANTIHFAKPVGSSFDYKPGQYLTLKATIQGESLRRAYSLCSSPLEDADLAVTVKRVDMGKFSNWVADHLKAGDTLEVMPPMGKFHVVLDSQKAHHYVLIGGGSGITPLMSILRSVLQAEPNSRITLLYGNRNFESIIFRQALEVLQGQVGDRLRVIHTLETAPADWSGMVGRMDRHKLMPILQDIISSGGGAKSYWMCGPAAMMEEAQSALSFLGVASKDIYKESFTAPLPDPEKAATVSSAAKARGDYKVTVILDDREFEVEVSAKTTILDAVIDAGFDPPYACQMGVCCTCRAKLISGSVEMEEDEGLSDSEIEEGYILTCQSHPLTPDCKLEYM